MENDTIPVKLRNDLQKDETVLWSGKVGTFPLINPGSKKKLTARWILSAAAFIVLSIVYVLLSMKKAGVMPAVIVILALIFGYVAFLPTFDRNRLLKKTVYFVTNQRIIQMGTDRDFFCIPKTGTKCEYAANCFGGTDVLIGAAFGLPAAKRFSVAIAPKKNDGGEVTGLVFYNVEDIDALKAAL